MCLGGAELMGEGLQEEGTVVSRGFSPPADCRQALSTQTDPTSGMQCGQPWRLDQPLPVT